MAASKKSTPSSKTAHVMNLISKSAPPPAEPAETPAATAAPAAPAAAPAAAAPAPTPAPATAAAPAAAAAEAPAAPQPTLEPTVPPAAVPQTAPVAQAAPAPKSPLIVSMSNEAAVSEQIREALEGALENALEQEEPPAPQKHPEVPSSPAPLSPPPVEPAAPPKSAPVPPAEDSEPKNPPASAPVSSGGTEQGEKIPQNDPKIPAKDPISPSKNLPQDITCVNIMQVLVEENANKYIKMYGLCTCPRCQADVKALALNNLQPKYVVMEPGHVVPRISVYEGRHNAAVTAQLMRACATVAENPRHDRDF